MSTERILTHFTEAASVLDRFKSDPANIDAVKRAGELMVAALRNGGKVISCGNGGSMCDAMHFAEELTGRFRDDRKPIAAVSISDPSHLTCVGNDHGFEQVFARYVQAHGRSGDVLLAISTSGNSPVGLTGKNGGNLAGLCDVEIRVPHDGYADRVQEVHIKVIHALIDHIERALA
jgi:D-sedoheptulose 7-phosphate isomerase